MQKNEDKISGVLKQQSSAKNYRLRRYFPDEELSHLVEQFWFVDWQIPGNSAPHTQQNLPDANFHLTLEASSQKQPELLLYGPISKAFSYQMHASGSIIGVKFKLGVTTQILAGKCTDFVDKKALFHETLINNIQKQPFPDLINVLSDYKNDNDIVKILQSELKPWNREPSSQLLQIRALANRIKTDKNITKVSQLTQYSNMSLRSIQRGFEKYIGLSPKWLIRKYRLHQVLALLEDNTADIQDIVEQLDYTDQAHLIHDFHNILGITPGSYTST